MTFDFIKELINSGVVPFVLSSQQQGNSPHGKINTIRIIEAAIMGLIMMWGTVKVIETEISQIQKNLIKMELNLNSEMDKIEILQQRVSVNEAKIADQK